MTLITLLRIRNSYNLWLKEGDSNIEEQEIVDFVEWPEFVNNHLVTGSVKTLVFDPEGLVMIVLKEDPDPKQQNTQTLVMEDNV